MTRFVTLEEFQHDAAALLGSAEGGETVVVIGDAVDGVAAGRAVLIGAAEYQTLTGKDGPSLAVRVAGVAGGVIAGSGAALSSITGKPTIGKDAKRLGFRVGKALAVGFDALNKSPKNVK